MEYLNHYVSPLGRITLAGDENALTGLWFDGQKHYAATLERNSLEKELPIFEVAKRWLEIYFNGFEPDFVPALNPKIFGFRREVWETLLTIPYGQVVTYGEIAERIAARRGTQRMSAQAVGGAVGRNPIALIVPCHRVIGAKGKLGGYAGGIDKKQKLLALEGVFIGKS